eukprot:SM000305S11800  [mRNA]  locus=s305:17753:18797:+ [translate_table: standard]
MPKVRTNRTKYPDGWELIEPTLRELEQKMREGAHPAAAPPAAPKAIRKRWVVAAADRRELGALGVVEFFRAAENDPHDGKRKCEALWPIFKISHQKSRYVYDLYYRRKAISRELYDFCLDQGYADKNLVAKWKKAGYERLCCLRCMQPRDHNFGTTCVCRVPKHLREEHDVECIHCGCRGCASGDR